MQIEAPVEKEEEMQEAIDILKAVENGEITAEEALMQLKVEPFQDLGYAKVDTHRPIRQGAAEVIFGESKTTKQHKTGGGCPAGHFFTTKSQQKSQFSFHKPPEPVPDFFHPILDEIVETILIQQVPHKQCAQIITGIAMPVELHPVTEVPLVIFCH